MEVEPIEADQPGDSLLTESGERVDARSLSEDSITVSHRGLAIFVVLVVLCSAAVGTLSAELHISSAEHHQSCDLCIDHQWIFVLGTGRSGSTTILKMLNYIPFFYIAGEDGGQLNNLYAAYTHAVDTAERVDALPFYHHEINMHELKCDLQQYTIDMIGKYDTSSTQSIGFKEIRITSRKHLDFMLELFPCAKFIINWRTDVEAQHESTFKAKESVKTLEETNDELTAWGSSHKESAFLLPCCDEYTVENFNSLLLWLGVFDCEYTSVIHANAGGTYSRSSDDFGDILRGTCALAAPGWQGEGEAIVTHQEGGIAGFGSSPWQDTPSPGLPGGW
jgi:hypothetical protein